ncbi:unnamed protein product [Lactuca saligna]|uniref:Uncharacterized protein n=1 Tax=Lactuca saligna TaxID=75948 RepID=A0AA35UWK4_LACSI|nr:unnamed protein product [Lactuca saligna]
MAQGGGRQNHGEEAAMARRHSNGSSDDTTSNHTSTNKPCCWSLGVQERWWLTRHWQQSSAIVNGDKKREGEEATERIAATLTALPIGLVVADSRAQRWRFGDNEIVTVAAFQLRRRLMRWLLPSPVGLPRFL